MEQFNVENLSEGVKVWIELDKLETSLTYPFKLVRHS